MNITDLEVINFRKFSRFKLENLKEHNVIIGKNGVGKTSIIESIYFGSISKSFKSYYDNVLIKSDAPFMKVKIGIFNGKKNVRLELTLNGKEKTAKINNQMIKKMSDYICQYSVILFSPDDIKLIKDSPNSRRNYLNIEISNINKNYLNLINNYNKIIKNKNDYLKKLNLNEYLDEKYLDVLDEKIADIGSYICSERKKYIEDINLYIEKVFKKFKTKDSLKLVYISDFDSKTNEEIIKLLKKSRQKEKMLGMTNIGIHRDDISFIHNDKDSNLYSSQGIQKLIILSLKISEVKLLIQKYKIMPILLLDDLFSELDEKNQNKIMKLLNKKVQVFITTTDINNIKASDLKDLNVIKIKESV